jgi:hypothetical protein
VFWKPSLPPLNEDSLHSKRCGLHAELTLHECSLHRDRKFLKHEHPCAKAVNHHRNIIQDPKSVRDSSMAILGLRLQRK